MKHLQTILHKFPNLTKLNLNLYANKIQTDGAITLSGGLFQQRQLKEFEIDLYLLQMEQNVQWEQLVQWKGISWKIIIVIKNLKDLSVNAATKNFGWDGYETIVSAIEKLLPLDNLELIIVINKGGQPGAELLKQALFKLKSLKINFVENYIGDAGATFIAEGIQYQQQLNVNMYFNSLSDRGELELAKTDKNAKSPKIQSFFIIKLLIRVSKMYFYFWNKLFLKQIYWKQNYQTLLQQMLQKRILNSKWKS